MNLMFCVRPNLPRFLEHNKRHVATNASNVRAKSLDACEAQQPKGYLQAYRQTLHITHSMAGICSITSINQQATAYQIEGWPPRTAVVC